jgi:hypothetical protein
MNANGTTTATNGASFGRRRLAYLLVSFGFAIAFGACTRSGTQESNEQAQAQQAQAQQAQAQQPIDPALARAVGNAVQPCIRAHRTPKSSIYTSMLRLERQPSGTAAATFLAGGTPGHQPFEACAVKAINGAAIALAQSTMMPVAFDFGPER